MRLAGSSAGRERRGGGRGEQVSRVKLGFVPEHALSLHLLRTKTFAGKQSLIKTR